MVEKKDNKVTPFRMQNGLLVGQWGETRGCLSAVRLSVFRWARAQRRGRARASVREWTSEVSMSHEVTGGLKTSRGGGEDGRARTGRRSGSGNLDRRIRAGRNRAEQGRAGQGRGRVVEQSRHLGGRGRSPGGGSTKRRSRTPLWTGWRAGTRVPGCNQAWGGDDPCLKA